MRVMNNAGKHRIEGARTEAVLASATRMATTVMALGTAAAYDLLTNPAQPEERLTPLMFSVTVPGNIIASLGRRIGVKPETTRKVTMATAAAIGAGVSLLMTQKYGFKAAAAATGIGAAGGVAAGAVSTEMYAYDRPLERIVGKSDRLEEPTPNNAEAEGLDEITQPLPVTTEAAARRRSRFFRRTPRSSAAKPAPRSAAPSMPPFLPSLPPSLQLLPSMPPSKARLPQPPAARGGTRFAPGLKPAPPRKGLAEAIQFTYKDIVVEEPAPATSQPHPQGVPYGMPRSYAVTPPPAHPEVWQPMDMPGAVVEPPYAASPPPEWPPRQQGAY